jgi:hypothetical protein
LQRAGGAQLVRKGRRTARAEGDRGQCKCKANLARQWGLPPKRTRIEALVRAAPKPHRQFQQVDKFLNGERVVRPKFTLWGFGGGSGNVDSNASGAANTRRFSSGVLTISWLSGGLRSAVCTTRNVFLRFEFFRGNSLWTTVCVALLFQKPTRRRDRL